MRNDREEHTRRECIEVQKLGRKGRNIKTDRPNKVRNQETEEVGKERGKSES